MTVNYKEYALALFELSIEEGCLEECFEHLSVICNALKNNPEYLKILSSNLLSANEKYSLAEEAFAGCNNTLLKFIKLLISKNIISSLSKCSDEFFSLYYSEKGIITAKVISASPLTEKQRLSLEKNLCSKTGKSSAIVKYSVDSSLIGGAVLRFNGEEIDYSIKRKLGDLKAGLIEK